MQTIELPNGQSAVLKSRDIITERMDREIQKAQMRAAALSSKLQGAGFDPSDSTSWSALGTLNDDEFNILNAYNEVLILTFLASWTLNNGVLPDAEALRDLPKATYDVLSDACVRTYGGLPDFSPDAVIDPKAPTTV